MGWGGPNATLLPGEVTGMGGRMGHSGAGVLWGGRG